MSWQTLLTVVPRDAFIPDVALVGPVLEDAASWIDRRQDPDGWWRAVHSDTAIGTQLNDGRIDPAVKTGADPAAMPTSSSSAPHLVAEMLALLDARAGHRVLEVGTGTGWTAALLARQVGQQNVTTIEIDAALAARATENLDAAGYTPQVIVGDGARGWEPGAPYDRVHVTAGVGSVPYAWVAQTRPGGVIVLPWMPGWAGAGHLLQLTVESGTATGRVRGACGFMMLRGQRPSHTPISCKPRTSPTRLDPRVFSGEESGLALAIAGLIPDLSGSCAENADGTFRVGARSGASRVLATYDPGSGGASVTQYGPRNLWDELEQAHRWWHTQGGPGPERYGVTVTRTGLSVWLDQPDNPLGRT